MKRIRLTKNLYLDEYIPREMYEKYPASILIGLLDERQVESDQLLRDRLGPVVINNWYIGGDRNWSGLRVPESRYYKMLSQHSFGRASDKVFTNVAAREVIEDIKKHEERYLVNALEDFNGITWVHTDSRWNDGKLLVFGK